MKLFSLKCSHTQPCIYTPMHVHPHIYTHVLHEDKLVEWNELSGSLVGARQIFSKNLAWQIERGGNGNLERAIDNKVTCSGCPAEHGEWKRKGSQSFSEVRLRIVQTRSYLFVFVGLFYMVWLWDTFDSEMFSEVLKGWTHLNKQMLGKCPTNLFPWFFVVWSGWLWGRVSQSFPFWPWASCPLASTTYAIYWVTISPSHNFICFFSDQHIRFFMYILY